MIGSQAKNFRQTQSNKKLRIISIIKARSLADNYAIASEQTWASFAPQTIIKYNRTKLCSTHKFRFELFSSSRHRTASAIQTTYSTADTRSRTSRNWRNYNPCRSTKSCKPPGSTHCYRQNWVHLSTSSGKSMDLQLLEMASRQNCLLEVLDIYVDRWSRHS